MPDVSKLNDNAADNSCSGGKPGWLRDILLLGLLLFSFMLGGCSNAGVPLAEAVGDPGTVVEEFMVAIAQSRLDNAERLWHPGIPREHVVALLEGIRDSANRLASPEVLTQLFQSADYVSTSVGYDRFIVTPVLNNSPLNSSSRFMVQRRGDGYAILLPGDYFDQDGMINHMGVRFFGTDARPDPNLSMQALILGMLRGDRQTVKKHVSRYTTDEVIDRLLAASEDERLGELEDSVLAAALILVRYPVYYVDPLLVILGEKPGERRLMIWEDNSWKVLPHEVSGLVYRDTSLPPFFEMGSEAP